MNKNQGDYLNNTSNDMKEALHNYYVSLCLSNRITICCWCASLLLILPFSFSINFVGQPLLTDANIWCSRLYRLNTGVQCLEFHSIEIIRSSISTEKGLYRRQPYNRTPQWHKPNSINITQRQRTNGSAHV